MAKRKSSTTVPAQLFPFKLTQLQREALIEHIFHQPQVTQRLRDAGTGPQFVKFSRRELDFIAAEITEIAASIPAPAKQRLVAVRKKTCSIRSPIHRSHPPEAARPAMSISCCSSRSL